MLQAMNPTQTHAPRFVSNASVAPKMQKDNKAKTQPKMQSKTPRKDIKFEDNDTRTSNILEDFDVKKAFIYSEILNTKFDE
jgi:hypothetical protein